MKKKIPPFFAYFFIIISVLLASWLFWSASSWPEVELNYDITKERSVNSHIASSTDMPNQGVGLANPASQNCLSLGGSLQIKERGDGGQFGLCYFEDNRACEEWALLRGECPVGGRRITGYDTEAQSYCAWLGGGVSAVENAICELPNGRHCLAEDLYNGRECQD